MITIGEYKFEGPFSDTSDIKDLSGVYAILDNYDSKFHVLDVGESHQLRTRLENHDRMYQWRNKKKGVISVAVYYTDEPNRMRIEKVVRNQYYPVCGDR